jgi:hypothetical protein
VVVIVILVMWLGFRGKRVIHHEIGSELLLGTWVPNLSDGGAVLIAGILSYKAGHVVFGLGGSVAGQGQFGHENSAENLLFGIHVWNVLHQQKTGPDLDVITLVTQLLQVGAKTYQFV